ANNLGVPCRHPSLGGSPSAPRTKAHHPTRISQNEAKCHSVSHAQNRHNLPKPASPPRAGAKRTHGVNPYFPPPSTPTVFHVLATQSAHCSYASCGRRCPDSN